MGGSKQSAGGDGKKGKRRLASDECAYCGNTGHWPRECRKKKKDEQAHATEAEAEATLMMGVASISVEPVHECQQAWWVFTEEEEEVHTVATAHVALATSTQATAREQVTLREDKLFIQLGEKSNDGQTRWILDTGVTNHMTSVRSAFSELDTGVRGIVRFGDGSMVDIHGHGTILFSYKMGEHQRLGVSTTSLGSRRTSSASSNLTRTSTRC